MTIVMVLQYSTIHTHHIIMVDTYRKERAKPLPPVIIQPESIIVSEFVC